MKDSKDKKPHPQDADINFLVNSQNLKGPPTPASEISFSIPQMLSDRGTKNSLATILEKVRFLMTHDPAIGSNQIRVQALGEWIVLEGKVDHQDLRSRAETLARSVEGVSRVMNHIKVVSGGISPSPIP